MSATTARPAARFERSTSSTPARAEGVELLGDLHGSGYKDGACLVRRGDGQMVQLGPLMYALLECLDGRRDAAALAAAMTERLGRRVGPEHVAKLAGKLAGQGLLAGSEAAAPPKRNPLLALRWKVLVTDENVTRRLTAPFAWLFRPYVVWPVLAAFAVVCWFVLVHKGVASATAEAFHKPELLLLVFALAIASAGFHELGHAAACRYGGAAPRGMGMGIYMVWPAFYTDVTDAYRLPKRDRLRVDLGGLYFNAVVAVVTMAVWLALHVDALLLLIALQLLQMVKQLSPVIRADGYHILSDATGIPDLYSHIGPTLRRLLPGGRREPSALTGRARLLVTLWVLIVVPVLLSLMLSAILLFPRLAASAWDSGRQIVSDIPHQGALDILASLVRLLALALPVLGTALVSQRITRTVVGKARSWSAGSPPRRVLVLAAGTALLAAAAWAWWPAGQYRPIRGDENGTLVGAYRLVSAPSAAARPPAPAPQPVHLAPGEHLAIAMIPVGGATKKHPAMFVIKGAKDEPAAVILSSSAPDPAGAPAASGTPAGASTTAPPPSGATAPATSAPVTATALPFKLPADPGPHGTQAVAVNTKDGGVTYDVAYALVTVHDGETVDETNAAYALASCQACTTVAVSFQVVLIIGQSNVIVPVNAAGALNVDCPYCITTALADQIVVTLKSQPSDELLAQLNAELKQLDALPSLAATGTPDKVAALVTTVQHEIEQDLAASGLLANQQGSTSTSTSSAGSGSGSTSSSTPTSTTPSTTTTTGAPPATTTTPADTSTTPTQTTTTETTPASTTTTETTTTDGTSTTSTTPTTTTP